MHFASFRRVTCASNRWLCHPGRKHPHRIALSTKYDNPLQNIQLCAQGYPLRYPYFQREDIHRGILRASNRSCRSKGRAHRLNMSANPSISTNRQGKTGMPAASLKPSHPPQRTDSRNLGNYEFGKLVYGALLPVRFFQPQYLAAGFG